MDAATLALCTGARIERAQLFSEHLTTGMDRFAINNTGRIACFLATVAIESGNLEDVEENLNYSSADRLRLIFPSLFRTGKYDAKDYVRNPKGLSQLRYGGCHGRGLIQLSLLPAYQAASKALGFDYVGNPDLVLQPEHAALTACWFFADQAKCLPSSDRGDMYDVTGRINGPARLKLAARKAQMATALKVLS